MDKNIHLTILKGFIKQKKSVTKIFHNYFLMVVIDKYQTGRSRGTKVLTPKKMF